MRKGRGFTIVELVVVLTIMSILLVLVTVGLSASQKNGRDAERVADVEAIARGLEVRFKQGNPRAVHSGGYTNPGQYPGVNEMLHILGDPNRGATWSPTAVAGGYLTDALPGTTPSNYIPPGATTTSLGITCVWMCSPAETMSVVNSQTTKLNYMYEPIGKNGEVCSNSGCVRFNIYYRNEDGDIQTYRSARQ